MNALGIIAYLLGILIFLTAKSAVHETVALLIILNGTIFIATAFIISAINKLNIKTETPNNVSE